MALTRGTSWRDCRFNHDMCIAMNLALLVRPLDVAHGFAMPLHEPMQHLWLRLRSLELFRGHVLGTRECSCNLALCEERPEPYGTGAGPLAAPGPGQAACPASFLGGKGMGGAGAFRRSPALAYPGLCRPTVLGSPFMRAQVVVSAATSPHRGARRRSIQSKRALSSPLNLTAGYPAHDPVHPDLLPRRVRHPRGVSDISLAGVTAAADLTQRSLQLSPEHGREAGLLAVLPT